jgi:hypothetical protein
MTIFYCLRFEALTTGGPDPRIYIPQEQGGSVTSPGTGFHDRRVVRLAGLWRGLQPACTGMQIFICTGELPPPLWSSGQSSWLQNGDVFCFL